MRELYLRSFESAIKEARMTIRYYDEGGNMAEKTMRAATAVMPAQNCVGTTVGHANYALLTGMLRRMGLPGDGPRCSDENSHVTLDENAYRGECCRGPAGCWRRDLDRAENAA